MSKQLLKSTSTVSAMTFFSRILGFIRDMVVAHMFGAGAGLDAFLVAFKIPNFMRRLFAEGAFSQAFVPVLSETVAVKSQPEVQFLIDRVCGCLLLVLTLITILGCVGAPFLITLFAPGFNENPQQFALASEMLRWTFPYLLLISMTAFFSGIQNAHNRFALPALTPVLLNISMIFAALYLTGFAADPVIALAWGVLLGGFLQLFFQLPAIYKLGLLPKPKIAFFDPNVKKVLKLMLPALIGASVMQINLLVDTIFASFLPAGSLTWLYYSDRLLEFPVGMFGVALATVVLPHLSKQYANKNDYAFSDSIDWAFRVILLIGIPCALGLILLAKPILSTLFQYGRFTAQDVIFTSYSLMALSLGLVGFLVVKIMVSAFYARQNTKLPLKVALVAISCNVIFNFILIGPFKHAGLALASTLSQAVQLSILLYVLLKLKHYMPSKGWLKYIFRLVLANTCMIAFLVVLSPEADAWLENSGLWRGYQLGILVAGSVVVYGAALWVVGLRFTHFNMRALSQS